MKAKPIKHKILVEITDISGATSATHICGSIIYELKKSAYFTGKSFCNIQAKNATRVLNARKAAVKNTDLEKRLSTCMENLARFKQALTAHLLAHASEPSENA